MNDKEAEPEEKAENERPIVLLFPYVESRHNTTKYSCKAPALHTAKYTSKVPLTLQCKALLWKGGRGRCLYIKCY